MFVDNDADVPAHPDRPEVLILRPVQLVEAHARTGGIQLKVEGGRLDCLLLLAGQFEQAIVKGAGESEVHTVVKWSCRCRSEVLGKTQGATYPDKEGSFPNRFSDFGRSHSIDESRWMGPSNK